MVNLMRIPPENILILSGLNCRDDDTNQEEN